jgi:hypothetical protein
LIDYCADDILLEFLVIMMPLLNFRLDISRSNQKDKVRHKDNNQIIVKLMRFHNLEPYHLLVALWEVIEHLFGGWLVLDVWQLAKQENYVDKNDDRAVDNHH